MIGVHAWGRRTLRGDVLGTFWKPPSQNPFWEPFSEPFFTVKPTESSLLRTLLHDPPQNLLLEEEKLGP